MMADVNDDVQTRTAVSGYRLVHRAVERRDERLERVALFARPEAHSRPVALRRDVPHEHIHTQVHPRAREGFLDHGDDAGLTGSWSAVQDDDLAGCAQREHAAARSSRR